MRYFGDWFSGYFGDYFGIRFSLKIPGYRAVAEIGSNAAEHLRSLAVAINILLQGKTNALADLTLTSGSATTVLQDARITISSFIGLMPTTANAAAGLADIYIINRVTANGDQPGQVTFTHANNSQDDRTYKVLIIG